MPRVNYEKEVVELNLKSSKTIHDRIKLLRYKKGETQEEFAFNIDINVSSLKRYERDEKPSAATLEKIAEYCNVTVSYILDGYVTEGYSPEFFEYATGLNTETMLALQEIRKDNVQKEILNCLFRYGVIEQLTATISANIEQTIIEMLISKFDKEKFLTKSITKSSEFAKWKLTSKLSEYILGITEHLIDAVEKTDDFTEHKEYIKNELKIIRSKSGVSKIERASLFLRQIYDKATLFKIYKEMEAIENEVE